MSTKRVIAVNLVLLAWFFLDMTGMSVAGHTLVSRAFREDGIFFLVYLALFIVFLLKNQTGSLLLLVWLSMWFLTQFSSHWYHTLFGPHEDKIAYFRETVKLIPSESIYVPDLYHIVLHGLIVTALFAVVSHLVRLRRLGR